MEITELYTVDAHEVGAEMQVKDAAGASTECYLTVYGIDSPTWATIQKDYRDRQIEALQNGNKDKIKEEMLSKAVKGWRNFTRDGEPVEFSTDLVKQLFLKAPYIVNQVDEFIVTRANFMKG